MMGSVSVLVSLMKRLVQLLIQLMSSQLLIVGQLQLFQLQLTQLMELPPTFLKIMTLQLSLSLLCRRRFGELRRRVVSLFRED